MAVDLFAYRGRNDDGNETTATWKAAQNTPWVQPVDVNFRVRFGQQNDTSALNNLDVQLQYSLNGGAFTNVTASSIVVRSSASPNLADQANLTTQLTGGTGVFDGATAFDEVNGICGGNSLDIAATEHFEVEYCVQLRGADVVNGDVVQLRTINSDTGTAWGTYTVTAELTAAASVSITPPVGALALAGVAPVVVLPTSITTVVGSLSITGLAPDADVSTEAPGTAFQADAFQIDAFQIDARQPPVGAAVLSGIAGRMDFGVFIPTEVNL